MQCKFQELKEFKYLGTITSSDMSEEVEIQNRLNLGNRGLFAINEIKFKIIVLLYQQQQITDDVQAGGFVCSRCLEGSQQQGRKLVIFKSEILRKICGPSIEGDAWRRKQHRKIRKLQREAGMISEAAATMPRWSSHIARRQEGQC